MCRAVGLLGGGRVAAVREGRRKEQMNVCCSRLGKMKTVAAKVALDFSASFFLPSRRLPPPWFSRDAAF